MRLIIAGSRDIRDYSILDEAMKDYDLKPDEIISGGARGVDFMGETYSSNNDIVCTTFPADWSRDGKAAGPIRNKKMAKYANEEDGALLLIWDGKSRGSASMLREAEALGLTIYQIVVRNNG